MSLPGDDAYLRECVSIDPINISSEFVRVAPDLAYWNERYAGSLRSYLIAKLDVEETEARLSIIHRERQLAAAGKATEGSVAAAVTNDPTMHEVRVRLIEAEAEKSRVSGMCEAVRSKRDMIVSLGAHVRAELKSDVMMRDQHRTAREYEQERGT